MSMAAALSLGGTSAGSCLCGSVFLVRRTCSGGVGAGGVWPDAGEELGSCLLTRVLCWSCDFLTCVSVWAITVETGSLEGVSGALQFVPIGPAGVQSLGAGLLLAFHGCFPCVLMSLPSWAGPSDTSNYC